MATRVTVDITPEPGGRWRLKGACRDYDPDLWFSPLQHEIELARTICREQCPVATKCLAWAHERGVPHGVWGGETEEQRALVLTGQLVAGTRTRATGECEHCGGMFHRGRKTQRYCSHACHNASLRVLGRTGCGSPHGARRHRNHGEPVDEACRLAESLYYAQRRAAKKAEKAREATP